MNIHEAAAAAKYLAEDLDRLGKRYEALYGDMPDALRDEADDLGDVFRSLAVDVSRVDHLARVLALKAKGVIR